MQNACFSKWRRESQCHPTGGAVSPDTDDWEDCCVRLKNVETKEPFGAERRQWSLHCYAATLFSFWTKKKNKTKRYWGKNRLANKSSTNHTGYIKLFKKKILFTLYSKSEKSRPPLPPLKLPLNPGGGGAVRGPPKEPLLGARPRPPRGCMKPRPRKPPLPRLCRRGMPKVSEFMRLSSAQVGLRSLNQVGHF